MDDNPFMLPPISVKYQFSISVDNTLLDFDHHIQSSFMQLHLSIVAKQVKRSFMLKLISYTQRTLLAGADTEILEGEVVMLARGQNIDHTY